MSELESQDYDQVRLEEKENEDRRLHAELKEEVTQALEDVMCQANKDELSCDDLLECIQEAWKDSQDSSLYTDVKRF